MSSTVRYVHSMHQVTSEEEKWTNSSADICVLNETRLMAVSDQFVFVVHPIFATLDNVVCNAWKVIWHIGEFYLDFRSLVNLQCSLAATVQNNQS